MPLPFALDHINLRLLSDDVGVQTALVAGGWSVVDCGVATDATRAGWEAVFAIEPEANPLQLQLYPDSLEKFAALPEQTLVLPSHGKPFRGLHTRIGPLRERHVLRLAEVMQACVQWQSAANIVPLMFRRALDVHQLGFALGEALAHLHLLWHEGKLLRQSGPDGIVRFHVM